MRPQSFKTSFSFTPMKVGEQTHISPTASIIGDVVIGSRCSIWEHAALRGDLNTIEVGDGSNIQDCCVVHASPDHPVAIGKNVSVGHGAIVHGATVEDDCIIGINATVLDGAYIERGGIIAAGAVVVPGMRVPAHSLVAGVPGKVLREDAGMLKAIAENAEIYRRLAERYLSGEFEEK